MSFQALGKRDIPTKLIEGEPTAAHQESMGDSFHPLLTSRQSAPLKPPEEHPMATTCTYPHPRHRYLL